MKSRVSWTMMRRPWDLWGPLGASKSCLRMGSGVWAEEGR